MNDESGLDSIPLGNEDQVVLSSQGEDDTGEVLDSEVVLRSVLVDHDPFKSQISPHPLDPLAHPVPYQMEAR